LDRLERVPEMDVGYAGWCVWIAYAFCRHPVILARRAGPPRFSRRRSVGCSPPDEHGDDLVLLKNELAEPVARLVPRSERVLFRSMRCAIRQSAGVPAVRIRSRAELDAACREAVELIFMARLHDHGAHGRPPTKKSNSRFEPLSEACPARRTLNFPSAREFYFSHEACEVVQEHLLYL
jgi:hypothetical protein